MKYKLIFISFLISFALTSYSEILFPPVSSNIKSKLKNIEEEIKMKNYEKGIRMYQELMNTNEDAAIEKENIYYGLRRYCIEKLNELPNEAKEIYKKMYQHKVKKLLKLARSKKDINIYKKILQEYPLINREEIISSIYQIKKDCGGDISYFISPPFSKVWEHKIERRDAIVNILLNKIIAVYYTYNMRIEFISSDTGIPIFENLTKRISSRNIDLSGTPYGFYIRSIDDKKLAFIIQFLPYSSPFDRIHIGELGEKKCVYIWITVDALDKKVEQKNIIGERFFFDLIIEDDKAYISGGEKGAEGYVSPFCLNYENKEILWKKEKLFKISKPISPLSLLTRSYIECGLKGNKFILFIKNHGIVVMDKNSGELIWARNIMYDKYDISQDFIYCANKNELIVLDIEDGKILYTKKFEVNDIKNNNGKIYVIEKYRVLCIDEKTGNKLWEYTSDFLPCTGTGTIDAKHLYVPFGNKIHIIDVNTGSSVDKYDRGTTENCMLKNDDKNLYIITNKSIVALSTKLPPLPELPEINEK